MYFGLFVYKLTCLTLNWFGQYGAGVFYIYWLVYIYTHTVMVIKNTFNLLRRDKNLNNSLDFIVLRFIN